MAQSLWGSWPSCTGAQVPSVWPVLAFRQAVHAPLCRPCHSRPGPVNRNRSCTRTWRRTPCRSPSLPCTCRWCSTVPRPTVGVGGAWRRAAGGGARVHSAAHRRRRLAATRTVARRLGLECLGVGAGGLTAGLARGHVPARAVTVARAVVTAWIGGGLIRARPPRAGPCRNIRTNAVHAAGVRCRAGFTCPGAGLVAADAIGAETGIAIRGRAAGLPVRLFSRHHDTRSVVESWARVRAAGIATVGTSRSAAITCRSGIGAGRHVLGR